MTGRIDISGNDISDTVKTVKAGRADPKDGIDVRIVLQVLQFHCIIGIDEHNDTGAVGFGKVQHILLILRKSEGTFEGITLSGAEHAGLIVRSFRAVAGDYNDCCSIIGSCKQIIRIHACRNFTGHIELTGFPCGRERRQKTCAREKRLAGVCESFLAGIEIDEIFIERKAAGAECAHKACRFLSFSGDCGRTDHTAQCRKDGVVSPEGHL